MTIKLVGKDMPMKYGYASTLMHDLDGLAAQVEELEKAGAKKFYCEHASAVGDREQLDRLMERLKEGDTLIVTKMDRLVRDVRELQTIAHELEARSVALRILDFDGDTVDTKTPTGKLMLQMFGAFAEFERSMMFEELRANALARVDKGETPPAMIQRIKAYDAKGMTRMAIAKKLGISGLSVCRALRQA